MCSGGGQAWPQAPHFKYCPLAIDDGFTGRSTWGLYPFSIWYLDDRVSWRVAVDAIRLRHMCAPMIRGRPDTSVVEEFPAGAAPLYHPLTPKDLPTRRRYIATR